MKDEHQTPCHRTVYDAPAAPYFPGELKELDCGWCYAATEHVRTRFECRRRAPVLVKDVTRFPEAIGPCGDYEPANRRGER